MLKLGYLNYIFGDLTELREDLRESNYSKYGEFDLVELENSHPDVMYENIKNEEQFLYTNIWERENDTARVIFLKPLNIIEAVLNDESLKMVYIKNENNEFVEICKKEDIKVMFNHEYNLACITLKLEV